MVTKVNSSNFSSAINATLTAAASIPTISSVQATDSSYAPLSGNYLDTVATAYIKITGTNFFAGSQVFIEGQLASSITYVSSTQLNVILPIKPAGTYVLYVVNPDGSVAIRINAVTYSASPVWSTGSTLTGANNESAVSIQLAATSDSSIVYTVTSGTLPPGLSLSTSGLLSGTVTGVSTETTYNFTVTATDTENQINPSSFSINITVGDPYFNYTTLLLNGETSLTPFIQDASTNNFGLTIAGDTKPNSFNPYTPEYYSNYFDGSGDFVQIPANATALDLGAGDFTIEFWLYVPGSWTSGGGALMGKKLSDSTMGWQVYRDGGNSSKMNFRFGSQSNFFSGSTPTSNTWEHWACVRIGTAIKLYKNGILDATTADGVNISDPTGSFKIGYADTWGVYGNYYFSNVRIVKGLGVYTGNFTVPTGPLSATQIANPFGGSNTSAITNQTSLLTCQSNRLIDNSTNNFTITKNGDVAVSSAHPFTPNSSYSTYGSGYFDGTGDWLSVPYSAAFSTGATYTFEAWVYPTVLNASNIVFQITNTTVANFGGWLIELNAAGEILFNCRPGNGGSNVSIYAGLVPKNAWTHVAVVVNNNAVTIFQNGIQVNTGTVAALDGTQNFVAIGALTNGYTASPFTGNIVDVRLIKGTALYTSNFTPPTAPLTAVANTQLLTLQYNGGANNNGFIDSSSFNNVLTRYGNTSQGTFSPYSQTGWSYYFDGTGALSAPNASASGLVPTTNDFTIECWIMPSAAENSGIVAMWYGGGLWIFRRKSNNVLALQVVTTGDVYQTVTGTSATFTIGTWNHVAAVRSGNVLYLYVNGVRDATSLTLSPTSIVWYSNPTSKVMYIGTDGDQSARFVGSISNFRYVVGTAVYTGATYTVPIAPLTAIAGTQILTLKDNNPKDNSYLGGSFTGSGYTVVASSPFSSGTKYIPSLHSGSAYFDGTGDYLSIPATPVLTFSGDFTIEAWVYPTVINTDNCIISRWTSSLSFIFKIVTSGRPYFAWYKGGTGTVTGTTTAVRINQWNHVAVTRIGSTVRLFVNGVVDATTGTIAGALDNSTTAITVGSLDTTPSQLWNGYLSDVRVINGTSLYSASFIPPTATLPNTTSSSLLLNFTNGGIIDQHSSNVLETIIGTQLSTAVKKYGNASLSFSGTANASMQFPAASQAIAFGTSDFTIECWVNFTASNGTYNPFVRYDGSGTFDFGYDFSTTQIKYSGSTGIFAVTQTFTPGTWYHVALTRASGSSRLFVNGIQVGTTVTGDVNNYAAGAFKIGGSSFSTAHVMNGCIDDLRITKGVARYTSSFTPPASQLLGQ